MMKKPSATTPFWFLVASAIFATPAIAQQAPTPDDEPALTDNTQDEGPDLDEGAAVLEEMLHIHGFGNWSAGVTDENAYLDANPRGRYDHIDFALSLSAAPLDTVHIFAQPWITSSGSEWELELDFAFVEILIDDALKLTAGRAKHPFGLYAEIYDVGTLRPFAGLPQGIYAREGGIAAEGYSGVGLHGWLQLGSGWNFGYDLYAGYIAVVAAGEIFESAEGEEEEEEEEGLDRMIGGRVIVDTPLEGVRIGGGAYKGEHPHGGMGHFAVNALAECALEPVIVRAEYVYLQGMAVVHTAYLEVAYRIFEDTFELAARGDWLVARQKEERDADPGSLGRHLDLAVGLNYLVSSNAVFKLGYHFIDGNYFARPQSAEILQEQLAAGTLVERTNLIELGASFSF